MTKKFELLNDDTIEVEGKTLYRLKALKDFGLITTGAVGGYIEKETNLSHEGTSWVYDDGRVFGDATVSEHAQVFDAAVIRDNARVSGYAVVADNAIVSGSAKIEDDVRILRDAHVDDEAHVYGDAEVTDRATVSGKANVFGHAEVSGNSTVTDYAWVSGTAYVYGDVAVSGFADISGDADVRLPQDYLVFKNNWSSFRHFTYTLSNQMWKVGCFYGTGSELIEKAYADSEKSGKHYEAYVKLVEELEKISD